jgi:hypothetical protein
MTTVPVGSASRGRFRAWRAAQRGRAEVLTRAFNSNAIGSAVDGLCYKAALGRERALRKLRRAFERWGARWTGTPEEPRWAFINPYFEFFGSDVPVIALGTIWVNHDMKALFNRPVCCLCVSEHAAMRFFQRAAPGADFADALYEAHANTLALSTTALVERKRACLPYYRLPAGDGAFACDVVCADKPDRHAGALLETLLLFARTWLHLDALSERQEAQIVPAGEVGDRFSEILWQPMGPHGGDRDRAPVT